MRRLILAAAFGAGLLGGAMPGSGDAQGSGRNDDWSHRRDRVERDHRFNQHDWRRKQDRGWTDNWSHRHRPDNRYGYGPSFGFLIQPYAPRPARPPQFAVRPCHATSKLVYDGHGRRIVISDVMCYDTYGRSYIVKGSRRIVHYY
jgi:hypothetical protein